MDDKTAELRDIFLDATDGEGTVTERQAERRGSLVDVDDPEVVDDRLRELVATMRECYDFETDLDPDAYVRLIRGFYDGDDDAALAEALGVDQKAVVRARLDCHLVRESDGDTPAVEASRGRATRANGRFRDAFVELLTDDDLSGRLASDSREDGLREATEDIETNVSL
ncbi:conditioned medium-induced protein 4 [Haloplanus rubicundus]|uniref:Conditioned medium-induced protein 4 n=1 Tax=Haloplanus rubicundus TaxID=1547898 RepID=A0A345DZF5_9EURY|nr:conditioned medium-induced protein 4 [Haloplanus rubicundus]AXG05327.1 conditioned medium-induced protein 4 [Haloplanus rubicundus]